MCALGVVPTGLGVCVCVRKGARLPGGPDERERESGLAAVIFVDRFCHSNSLIHHPFIS